MIEDKTPQRTSIAQLPLLATTTSTGARWRTAVSISLVAVAFPAGKRAGVASTTREPFSVASLVGFISLTGIATRNGVLMVSHYIHLMTEERRPWSKELIIQGSQERVAPVLMTAVTAGLGLIPLVLSKGEPGKEILYPVAVVILGGLITSTLLDFFVTPSIFYRFGKAAAERLTKEHIEKHGALPQSHSDPTTAPISAKSTVAIPAGASDRGNASASALPESGRPAAPDQGVQQ